ncbi:MAG: MBL fold metallo-hydrolase [Chloroflexota bacterium]
MDVPHTKFAVTVLGSGGPILNPTRASSGYVVWMDGTPRLLVDAGGGTFVRMGESGLDLRSIDTVLLTHTHIDHTGGLAPFVMATYMAGRSSPLSVVGPAGRGMHPGCQRFTELLFGTSGAWSYMNTFDGFGISARDVPSDTSNTDATDVSHSDDLVIRSVPVPHGMMPAVAYRIDYGDLSVVFSGDVQEAASGLIELSRGCDVLIHDQAVPEEEVAHSHLHTKPSETARVARDAGCGVLVLTHFMPEIDAQRDKAVATIREGFHGEVVVAHDLMTIPVGRTNA